MNFSPSFAARPNSTHDLLKDLWKENGYWYQKNGWRAISQAKKGKKDMKISEFQGQKKYFEDMLAVYEALGVHHLGEN